MVRGERGEKTPLLFECIFANSRFAIMFIRPLILIMDVVHFYCAAHTAIINYIGNEL